MKNIKYQNVDQSVYDFQKENTEEFKDNYSYRFFKRNIPYSKSSKQIENIAKFLHGKKSESEVKTGDVIAVIAPMLPEVISSFYAISKNGATFFAIDPRTNAKRIKEFLNLAEVKTAFVLDMAYGKLEAIIDETNLKNVVVLSVMDSMYKFLGLSYHYQQMRNTQKYYDSIKKIGFDNPNKVDELLSLYEQDNLTEKDKCLVKKLKIYQQMREIALKNLYYTSPPKTGYINFKDAMKEARNYPDFLSINDNDVPASLTLTSGTTGKPKVVPTLSRSYNVKVRDYSYTTMPIEKGDRILSMPPFILYGEIFMHMAYSMGVQNVIIPDITKYYYPDIIRKEKISHAVGVPSQALTLTQDKNFKNKLPNTLKTVSVGGTKMLGEHEKEINEVLGKSGIKVTQGYSMTELTPSSMTNMPGYTKNCSVGRPLGDVRALVVDKDTLKVLKCNEVGTLLINSETQFTGYYKNEEESKKVFIEMNGVKYVNTGDKAYYDEDGFYFIIDRDKEMIIRPDGHNNFPSEMEELIVSHPYVTDCAVVGVPYPNYESPTGYYPKAHVVLKKEYKNILSEEQVAEELTKFCLENLPERDVPYYYQTHDVLPLNHSLKPDKITLQQMDKNLILSDNSKKVFVKGLK